MSDRQKRKARYLRRRQEQLKQVMQALLEYHPSTVARIRDYGNTLEVGNYLYHSGRPVTARFELHSSMITKKTPLEELVALGKRFIDNALLQCDKDADGKNYMKGYGPPQSTQ